VTLATGIAAPALTGGTVRLSINKPLYKGALFWDTSPGARGQLWLALALGLIVVTASITAVQRTWHVRTQLRKEEQGAQ
jgi:uncharacterized membrane protein